MLIVNSIKDNVSVAIADKLKEYISFEDKGLLDGFPYFASGDIKMIEINMLHINADFLNKYNDTIMFLSKHSSEKGVSSFTVHPTGNFGS
ncbi:MAG: D-aminoacyl-tRNA deacylase, partial [Candidatus Micrarchaeia archaeon]